MTNYLAHPLVNETLGLLSPVPYAPLPSDAATVVFRVWVDETTVLLPGPQGPALVAPAASRAEPSPCPVLLRGQH